MDVRVAAAGAVLVVRGPTERPPVTTPRFSVLSETFRLEDRGRDGVSYDEAGVSHVVHPNGTLMATKDREMCAALARHVLVAHGLTLNPTTSANVGSTETTDTKETTR